ncbi:MAG: HAMP domain-containing histidine kinase [Candidatus Scalindua sp.]|nr:HAMP domain-containing histidine kinase [Candidatus Scalindua sp.]MCR4345359.1 HAMP domain-containing histidine kinase [Candidatus Scalindua sp.]
MSEVENILGIVVADKDGIIKSVSQTNGSLLSGLIGTKWYDAFSIPVEEVHVEKERNPVVFRLRESGNKLSVFPSYDKEGNIFGFHILVEKNCEGHKNIQFLNKVSCLGEIAPEIAHEINNPLAYVSGWLQIFLAETNDTDPKKKTYETLIGEFERIGNLTNSLLDFAKHASRPKKTFDVNQVIEDVITMIGYAMKNENVEIKGNFTFSEIVVHGESNGLKQVVLNVMQNAREAMKDGGTIYIRTNIIQDNLIQIRFRDTGCGMSQDQLSKAFSHSYTTRADGRGSGLGLSVCKNIIEEFGGTIDLESKRGEGTVVYIKLPKCSAE